MSLGGEVERKQRLTSSGMTTRCVMCCVTYSLAGNITDEAAVYLRHQHTEGTDRIRTRPQAKVHSTRIG